MCLKGYGTLRYRRTQFHRVGDDARSKVNVLTTITMKRGSIRESSPVPMRSRSVGMAVPSGRRRVASFELLEVPSFRGAIVSGNGVLKLLSNIDVELTSIDNCVIDKR